MKFTWEAADLEEGAGGNVVMRRGDKSKRLYMIGYVQGSGAYPCLVSLADGLVVRSNDMNRLNFVTMLNEQEFEPVALDGYPQLETYLGRKIR